MKILITNSIVLVGALSSFFNAKNCKLDKEIRL